MTPPPGRVFITGARGFIGRALAERFRRAGSEVTGVDIEASGDGTVIAGDITRPGDWRDAMAGADVVLHTAAVVSNAVPLARCWDVNVLGTRRVVEAAAAHGAGRLVHLSSVRVYSDRDFPDGVDETWPVRTDGHAYVDTKIAAEQVVLQAHAAGEVDVTVVRPGDVYGPGSRPWTVIPVLAIREGRFLLPAGGRGTFSPAYVDNLVDGVVAAATRPEGSGQVFNLCDGVGVANRTFFGHYHRMCGRRPLTAPTTVARALFAASGFVDRRRGRPSEATPSAVDYFLRTGTYSIERARALLDFDPAIDLDEGMARTEAWLRTAGLLPASPD